MSFVVASMLIRVFSCRPAQSPARSTEGVELASFGTDRHQITIDRLEHCTRRLERHVFAKPFQTGGQIRQVLGQQRFPAGHHHMLGLKALNLFDDIVHRS